MSQSEADLQLAAARARAAPAVAQPANRWLLPLGAVGVVMLGVATFAALRSSPPAPAPAPAQTAAPAAAPLPPPPTLAPTVAPVEPEPQPLPPPEPVAAPPPEPAPVRRVTTTPALVVDTTGSNSAEATEAGSAGAAPDKLSPNEAFAERLSRAVPDSVGTDRLASTDLVVPQGTVILAVLETAIDSDLPGLVRAVVSRDVRGFDGSKVLIPRGSRLVGQYSSGVALNQSRAFVIWTRVLRSDGVSVQLASAATDPLGTAGLGGKVNTHFFRRFGAATLLSVLTAGLEYLANSAGGGSQVLVGNVTQANQLASIALQRQIDIAPTIRVPQGTPVRVFVARDLDFGTVRQTARVAKPAPEKTP
jgi:type IV secretion system protein VirB10